MIRKMAAKHKALWRDIACGFGCLRDLCYNAAPHHKPRDPAHEAQPQSEQAVKFVSGPCLVLAGAGSGKTRVITNKIAYLVQQCGYNARNIAAVTFTNKAARDEGAGRPDPGSQGGARADGLHLPHSGARDHPPRAQEPEPEGQFFPVRRYRSAGAAERADRGGLDNDKDKLSALISQISNWKNDLILPARAMRIARGPEEVLLAQLYERYHRQMVAYNALDFDDLIVMPTLLLKSNEEVRTRWQNKIRYLLVDEYQDTNTSQYELVKQIVGERARFTVVGTTTSPSTPGAVPSRRTWCC